MPRLDATMFGATPAALALRAPIRAFHRAMRVPPGRHRAF
jgi:hypothetical protein